MCKTKVLRKLFCVCNCSFSEWNLSSKTTVWKIPIYSISSTQWELLLCCSISQTEEGLSPSKQEEGRRREASAGPEHSLTNTTLSWAAQGVQAKPNPLEILAKPTPKWDCFLRVMVKSRHACCQPTAGRKRGCRSSQIKSYSNICELKIVGNCK